MDLDVLLEAERRGILPPDKAELLQEARSRGLVPSEGGVSTNSEAVDEFQRKGQAFLSGAHDMASFGLGDTIRGAGNAIGGELSDLIHGRDGPSFGERYREGRDDMRAIYAQDREEEPTAFTGGQIAGGAAASLPYAKLATGRNLLGTMLRSGGIGATEGGLYAAASNDGRGDLVRNTLRGAGLGFGIGFGAPALVAGTQAAWRAAKDPVTGIFDSLANRANTSKANRAIAGTVRASGKNTDDVAAAVRRAAIEGQPDYRVMDALGVPGQRQTSGMVRSGGGTADEIADFLRQRQADAKDRVLGFTDEAFDMQGQTGAAWRDTVKGNRKKVADTLYDQAARDAGPVDVRDAVARLDRTISQMDNSGIKPPAVVKEFKKLRAKLAGKTAEGAPTTLSDYNSVLAIWREVRDQVDKAYKAGDGNIGEALKPIRDSLQQSLEESSDLYRFATDNYRAGSQVLDAFDTGADAAKRGRAGDTVPRFQGMTEQQQRAARIGYGDTVSEAIERNKAVNPNPAREYASTKRQAEAAAIANDPDLLQRRIARENEMFETQNRALGGSRTADNLQDIESTGEAASGALGAARSAANFQLGDTAAKIAAMIGPMARGENEATRQLIARALMSRDPAAVLGPAMRQEMKNQSGRRIIEAILRSAGRSNQE